MTEKILNNKFNDVENQSEVARAFKVEQRHYDKIREESNNLLKNNFTISTGNLLSDCMKYKIAAEILGYKAEEVGSDNRGYPYGYKLTKMNKN